MKIGILTAHSVMNYGAFLQAYCLQEYLKSLGHAAEIINYPAWGFKLNPFFYFPRKLLIERGNLKDVFEYYRERNGFYKEYKKFLRLSAPVSSLDAFFESKPYEAVILGSDEIWNIENRNIGYVAAYFSHGIKAKKIISYATSFGTPNAIDDLPSEALIALKRIQYLSVRDELSKRRLESLSLSSVKCLDPTFLFDIKNFEKPLLRNEYTFLYFNNDKPEIQRKIREFSVREGLSLVSGGHAKTFCDLHVKYLSPFRWLGVLNNAKYVITNTLHGVIFSILKKKPFLVLKDCQPKVSELVEDLSLQDCFVSGDEDLGMHLRSLRVDYEKVFKTIEEKRKESESFLRKSLSI